MSDRQPPYPGGPYQRPVPPPGQGGGRPAYGPRPYAQQPPRPVPPTYPSQPSWPLPVDQPRPYPGEPPRPRENPSGPYQQTPQRPRYDEPDEPRPKRRKGLVAFIVVLFLVVAGAVGYGAYDFHQQEQDQDRATQQALTDVGGDLSTAVASMRKVSYEVTSTDVSAWLQDPKGYQTDLSLRVLSSDSDGFSIAGYRTWKDRIAKRSHVSRACASVTLAAGIKSPVTVTTTTCPDSAPRSAPAPVSDAKVGELAGPTEQARAARAKTGAGTQLLTLAAPTKPVGDLHQESVSLMCAPGTTDIGTNDGYIEGKKVAIRLCSVNDLPSDSESSTPGDEFYIKGAEGHAIVNARVSGAVAALIAEARKHGLEPAANSSFRSMPQQQDTCNQDLSGGCLKGDYTFVAQPGFSNHQIGAAIDFDFGPAGAVKGADKCDATRAKQPASRLWRFLNNNALKFGFRQYAPESWHWDTIVAPDRCQPV